MLDNALFKHIDVKEENMCFFNPNPEDREKECEEISNQRGQSKRPIEIVSRLDYLFTKTQNISLKIKLTSLSILICFDASPGQFSSISIELWDKIYNSILIVP